jgi:hypothetical protein
VPAGDELMDVCRVAGVPEDEVFGELNTRWSAKVSSTTPRLDPRWPPCTETDCTMNSRSVSIWSGRPPPKAAPTAHAQLMEE